MCFASTHLFLGCTLCAVIFNYDARHFHLSVIQATTPRKGGGYCSFKQQGLAITKASVEKKKKKIVEVSDSSPTFFSQLCALIVLHFVFSLPPTLAYKQHC